jgi:hypothetical protein
MRRLLGLAALAVFGIGIFAGAKLTRAQNTTFSIQIAPGTTSTNCSVVASQTTFCFTGGGSIYASVNGAAFVLVAPTAPTTAAVTSVQVCPLTGTCSTTAQTGAVVVKVPQTAPAVTLQ